MTDKPKRKPKPGAKAKNSQGGARTALIAGALGVVMLGGFAVALSLVTMTGGGEVAVIEAVSDADRAATEAATGALPPYARGVAHLERGRFLAAAAAFTEDIESNPGNLDAWYGRARAYHGVGDFDTALAGYNRVLGDNPDYDPAAWLALAELYWEQFQRTDDDVHLPDALAAAEEAITRMERAGAPLPDAYRLAGTVQDQLGNHTAALRHYRAYVAAAPVPSPVVENRIAELERQ